MNTKNSDKDHEDFTRNFLPRFAYSCHFTKKADITNKEFLNLCRVSSETYDSVLRNQKDRAKFTWQECLAWEKKWRRKYGDFWDFKRAASRGTLQRD